ncbi:uncharacterized protein HLK63_I03553 [Nakaseomyces glabratus]|nr:uncharacterized protein GW608_I03553 [Nakaseomyces glabratus]UCS26627.1 uncharacterized protein HLK63_I03553 [Nakaseomyces glabratus]UCS31857.1 uncharacterized protein HLK64_I03553 [Nakaseomyces glabratus]UCS37085.1 uncharacterized protein HLK62_I03553 [Nakaseomyces glabratus]
MPLKLTNFLRKLQNQYVTLELQNGSTVYGMVISVSPHSNINLRDATLDRYYNSDSVYSEVTPQPISTSHLKNINVKECFIRQVILPDSLDLDSILVNANEVNGLTRSGKLADLGGNRKRRRRSSSNMTKRLRG